MRDFLFAFWGIMTAITVIAGAVGTGILVSYGAPGLMVASSIAGTVVSGVLGLTIMFVIDEVGGGR